MLDYNPTLTQLQVQRTPRGLVYVLEEDTSF